MRSQVFKSGSVAYVLASLVAILWLSVSVAHARSFRETTFATQVALLGNTLLGAAQNLDAISTQGDDGRGDDTVRLLVNAEASLAQAEIVALGYEQISGKKLPIGTLAGFYTAQIRVVREDLGRGNSLSPENLKALLDIKSDLELLGKACRGDVLTRGNQQSITTLFENTAAELTVNEARTSFEQSKPR